MVKDIEETNAIAYNIRKVCSIITIVFLSFLIIFHLYKLLTIEEKKQLAQTKKALQQSALTHPSSSSNQNSNTNDTSKSNKASVNTVAMAVEIVAATRNTPQMNKLSSASRTDSQGIDKHHTHPPFTPPFLPPARPVSFALTPKKE